MCTVLPSYVKGNSSLVSTCTRCKASHIPHSQILCAVTLLRTGSYNLVLVQFHCAEIPTSSPIKSRNKSEQIKPLEHHMEEISVSTSWICQCQRLEIIFKGGLKSQPWTYRLKKVCQWCHAPTCPTWRKEAEQSHDSTVRNVQPNLE